MKKGKLYISNDGDVIVKCTKDIIDDNSFPGIVVKSNDKIYLEGTFNHLWVSNNFIEYNELVTSSQIGGDHYKSKAIQPIEYILANKLDFCSGNVVKYITRYKDKNGLEDLQKAKQYIDFLMMQYENKESI